MFEIISKGRLRNQKLASQSDEKEYYFIKASDNYYFKQIEIDGKTIPSMTNDINQADIYEDEIQAKKCLNRYGGKLGILTKVAYYEDVITNVDLQLNDFYIIALNQRSWYCRVQDVPSFEKDIFEADRFSDYTKARHVASDIGGTLYRVSITDRYETL